jgi:hypothetical protein
MDRFCAESALFVAVWSIPQIEIALQQPALAFAEII